MRGRWGERGPAWQAVDVPEPRVCRLHLGHVRGKRCCCCSRVLLAARGCKWQGEMWDGAELGPAASVYAPREGGRRAEQLWCVESQLGAGVHGEPDRGLGQPQALMPGLLPLLDPQSCPSAQPWVSFGLHFDARSHPQPFNPHPSLLCSADLAEFGFTFLLSVLKTIVKFLKRG